MILMIFAANKTRDLLHEMGVEAAAENRCFIF